MSDPRKRLIDFAAPAELPSLILARQILAPIYEGNAPLAPTVPTILDGYEDQGYGPSMAQIKEWVDRETEAMVGARNPLLDAFNAEMSDAKSDLYKLFHSNLDAYARGEINKDELELSLANSLTWLDTSPFVGGTPLDAYWHAAKVQSALYEIYKNSSAIVDIFYDLLQSIIAERLEMLEILQSGSIGDLSLDDFEGQIALHNEMIQAAFRIQEENTSLAVKIGFMYRDAWWLEKHGDAALKGYIAKETALKAGSGGSTSSTAARRKRLQALLRAHAVMVRDNRILLDDPMEEVAYRALKLARKANPDLFGKVGSKKTAVEYWEYIKSDTHLWREYQDILLYNSGLPE